MAAKDFGLGVVRARKVAHIQFNPNLCASGESTLLPAFPAVRVTKTATFSVGPAPSSQQSLAFSRCSLKHRHQWKICESIKGLSCNCFNDSFDARLELLNMHTPCSGPPRRRSLLLSENSARRTCDIYASK